MEDHLEEELVAIQIDGAPAHLAPEDGDVIFAAVCHVHFLLYILKVTDADIGRRRSEEIQPLPAEAGLRVIEKLRVLPRDALEKVQLHRDPLS
jgi:hypothetical protein